MSYHYYFLYRDIVSFPLCRNHTGPQLEYRHTYTHTIFGAHVVRKCMTSRLLCHSQSSSLSCQGSAYSVGGCVSTWRTATQYRIPLQRHCALYHPIPSLGSRPSPFHVRFFMRMEWGRPGTKATLFPLLYCTVEHQCLHCHCVYTCSTGSSECYTYWAGRWRVEGVH